MKLVSILQSQAFQVFRPLGSYGYLPDAVKKVTDEFKFVEFPKESFELFPADATKPIVFRHGRVVVRDRVIVIDWLQVYPSGLTVITHTGTIDALYALNYVTAWTKNTFSIQLETTRDPGFWNQVNIRFDRPLPELFPQIKRVAETISKHHPNFLAFRPRFELTSVVFSYEPKANLNPVGFRIERAANIPFDENVYLSDAPLTTEEHLEILEHFERTALSD